MEVSEILKTHGKRPVHYLDELGLLDSHLIAAHGVHLDETELRCFHKKNAGIVHVPESNMKLSLRNRPSGRDHRLGIKSRAGHRRLRFQQQPGSFR